MDAKVTTSDMTNAITIAIRMARGLDADDLDVALYAKSLEAARDYILAAESQIAERDARIAHLERKFDCGHRFYDWASPEESCVACAAQDALYSYESEVLAAGFGTIAEMVAQIAEMRKVTGPKCPKCGHWLNPREMDGHIYFDAYGTCGPDDNPSSTSCYHQDIEKGPCCKCDLTVADLLANHPLIAADLGLTEANHGE